MPQRTNEQDEILAKFYTIRATLSAMDQKYELAKQKMKNVYKAQLDGVNSEIAETKRQYNSCQNELEYINNTIHTNEENLKSAEQNLEKLKDSGDRKDEKKDEKAMLKRWLISLGIMVFGGICFGLCYTDFMFFIFHGFIYLCMSIGYLCLLGGFISSIVFFVKWLKMHNENKNYIKNATINRNNAITYTERNIKQYKQTYQENLPKRDEKQKQIAVLEKELKSLKTQSDIIIKNAENDAEIITYRNEAELIASGLNKQFDDLIDERDWRNTDLIIYLIETGRADDVKEALQLVDKARRHDELLEAIEDASSQISSSLSRGFERLGTLVYSCCHALSKQVDSLSAEISVHNKQMEKQFAEISSSVNDLLKTEQLSAALQAQANKNSDQLVNEIAMLRDNQALTNEYLRRNEYTTGLYNY